MATTADHRKWRQMHISAVSARDQHFSLTWADAVISSLSCAVMLVVGSTGSFSHGSLKPGPAARKVITDQAWFGATPVPTHPFREANPNPSLTLSLQREINNNPPLQRHQNVQECTQRQPTPLLCWSIYITPRPYVYVIFLNYTLTKKYYVNIVLNLCMYYIYQMYQMYPLYIKCIFYL